CPYSTLFAVITFHHLTLHEALQIFEERLAELQAEYRRLRQESVTQELMDVMGGAEAARARDTDTERRLRLRERRLRPLGRSVPRSEEHTSELQSRENLVFRRLPDIK